MLSGRTTARILLWLGGLALVVIIVANAQLLGTPSTRYRQLAGGLMWGTYFGLIALAGAWMAMGFARWTARCWQSMLLCALAASAVCASGLLWGEMPQGDFLAFGAVVGIIAIAQFLLIAAPLALLFTTRQLGWRPVGELRLNAPAADQQFGIREMLVVTAGTAGLLGVLRWLVQSAPWRADSTLVHGLAVLGYLAACNVFVSLPLLVAPLMRRYSLVATLLPFALIALITECEIAAFQTVERNVSNERLVFWVINYSQALWVLLALGTLRAGGYRLVATALIDLPEGIALAPKDTGP